MQPLGESMELEVWLGSERRPGAGVVFDDAEALEDMRLSLRTLSALVAEGLFVRRGETSYMLEYRFHSEADWQEFLARPKAGGVEADPDLLASALAHPDGCIVTTEETTITTYERAGRSG